MLECTYKCNSFRKINNKLLSSVATCIMICAFNGYFLIFLISPQEREQKQRLLDPAPVRISQRFSGKDFNREHEVCACACARVCACALEGGAVYGKSSVSNYKMVIHD